MNANQLEPLVRSLEAQVDNLKDSLSEMRKAQEKYLDILLKNQSQLDKTQQQLADHIAHVEKWDARRWATIGFFIAGLVSLVANLVVVLVRK